MTLLPVASRQIRPRVLSVLHVQPKRLALFRSEEESESKRPAERLKHLLECSGKLASDGVLLRPHRDAQGNWHALVIFVDAQKWPAAKEVFLNGQPRDVSLDLYEAMKKDAKLNPFRG